MLSWRRFQRSKNSLPSRRLVRADDLEHAARVALACVYRRAAGALRHEHSDPLPVAPILVAELGDEVAFLEPDADEDVTGRRDGE
jgi:hypothetical protein